MSPTPSGEAELEQQPDSQAAVRGTLALATLQLVGRMLGLSFVLVATRLLSPADFGRYAIASALLLGASTVADLGTTTVITKMVSRWPDRTGTIIGAAVVPSAALGLLSLGGILAFAHLSGYDSTTKVDVLVAGLGLPADAVATSLLGAMDGRGLISQRARLSLLRVSVVAGGGFVAVVVTGEVRLALAALAIGPIITLALSFSFVRARGLWNGRPLLDRPLVALLLRNALPFAVLGGINVIVLRADLVILSMLASTAEVARYDVALRATEALTFLATAVAAPSLFILSRRIALGDIAGAQRAFDKAIRAAYLVGLPASAVLVALADPLVTTVFGSAYSASGPLLSILGLQLWLAFAASIQGSLLLAGGHLRRAVALFSLVALFAVVLEVIAIHSAGATGAAIAMVLLQSAIVVSAAWFSRRSSGVALRPPPLGAVAAALASGSVMAALSDRFLVFSAAAGLMTYGMLLLISGTVSRRDLADLRTYRQRT